MCFGKVFAGTDIVIHVGQYLLRKGGIFPFHVFEEPGECFHVLIEGAAFLQFADGERELVEGFYVAAGDGAAGSWAGEQLIGEMAKDVVAFLDEERGDVGGGHFEALPAAIYRPLIDGASVHVEEVCDLCFGKVCLEEQVPGLLLLFVFHGCGLTPCPPKGGFSHAICTSQVAARSGGG